MVIFYLDIFIGDPAEHSRHEAAYNSTCSLLTKNASIYGLPPTLSELSEEQREILQDLDVYMKWRLCI